MRSLSKFGQSGRIGSEKKVLSLEGLAYTGTRLDRLGHVDVCCDWRRYARGSQIYVERDRP